MKNLIRTYQGLVILIGSIVVVVGMVIYVILPKINEITALRDQIKQQIVVRDDLLAYVAYLEELAASTLEVEEDLVNYALPSENDVISLIVTYEGLSRTENILVSPFEFTPGLVRKSRKNTPKAEQLTTDTESTIPTAPLVSELPFAMAAETEDQQVAIDFLKSIYKTRRVYNIKNLSWTNPDLTKPEDKTIDVALSLLTYYYQTPPVGYASRELVNKGKTQTEFIQQLRETSVYEDLVLDAVTVGKLDLFRLDEEVKKQVQKITEPPVEQESTPSAVISPAAL